VLQGRKLRTPNSRMMRGASTAARACSVRDCTPRTYATGASNTAAVTLRRTASDLASAASATVVPWLCATYATARTSATLRMCAILHACMPCVRARTAAPRTQKPCANACPNACANACTNACPNACANACTNACQNARANACPNACANACPNACASRAAACCWLVLAQRRSASLALSQNSAIATVPWLSRSQHLAMAHSQRTMSVPPCVRRASTSRRLQQRHACGRHVSGAMHACMH
jgi:hypothetical protein